MDEKKKRGAPSVYDESLGTGTHYNHYAPDKVHDLLKNRATKKVLSKMALDENYKQQVWDSANKKDPTG